MSLFGNRPDRPQDRRGTRSECVDAWLPSAPAATYTVRSAAAKWRSPKLRARRQRDVRGAHRRVGRCRRVHHDAAARRIDDVMSAAIGGEIERKEVERQRADSSRPVVAEAADDVDIGGRVGEEDVVAAAVLAAIPRLALHRSDRTRTSPSRRANPRPSRFDDHSAILGQRWVPPLCGLVRRRWPRRRERRTAPEHRTSQHGEDRTVYTARTAEFIRARPIENRSLSCTASCSIRSFVYPDLLRVNRERVAAC